MGDIEKKLKELGLILPAVDEISTPVYEKAKQIGNQVFVAGHGPQKPDGEMGFFGRVGRDISLEEGYEAAKLCALDCLASIKALLGSLDRVSQITMVRGFVNSADDFFDQPKVLNGASDILLRIFGEQGRHSRTAIGTSVLPRNLAVVVDMQVAVRVD